MFPESDSEYIMCCAVKNVYDKEIFLIIKMSLNGRYLYLIILLSKYLRNNLNLILGLSVFCWSEF